MSQHSQALEERITGLENENTRLRQILNLPPSTRPPLGRGPTGQDQPYQPEDADRARHQTISPNGQSPAGSPSSSPLSIAPSVSSSTMPAMVVNERHSLLSHHQPEQGHCTIEPIVVPLPFRAPSSSDYSERIPPPSRYLSSSQETPTSNSPTSDRSIESNFDSREPHVSRRVARDDVLYHWPSQNSERYLHTTCIHNHHYRDLNQSREWNAHSSDSVYTLF